MKTTLTAFLSHLVFAGCGGGAGENGAPSVIPWNYNKLNNMIYPWFLPDWWPYDLEMFYGYKIKGILYSYERVRDPITGEVIDRTETTYQTEMIVDGKGGRAITTLWKYEKGTVYDFANPRKIVSVDYTNARIQSVD